MIIVSGATNPESPFVLYKNYLDTAAFLGAAAPAGFEVENLLGPQTYDYWKPSLMNALPRVVLPVPRNVDCMVIANHNFGKIGITRVYADWRLDAAAAWTRLFTILPPDITDDDICAIFPQVFGAEFRMAIEGVAAPTVGLWAFGKRLVFPAVLVAPYTPARLAQRVEGQTSISAGGHYLGATSYKTASDRMAQFSPIARGWAEADLLPFLDYYNARGAFWFAGGPVGMPADLSYSWRPDGREELRPEFMGGDLIALAMGLASYVA